ncbi:MAG TPA: prolipoprotein diacylglyceryl transferase [Campylobacterales bacterium]|nr:prolipoprotein diacylglyceryl transferase [Campylobacterales bacterium]HIO71304.1 prolipoprotein diacylglyceryl transferase [Campylobacterales bacterium]
MEYWNNIYENFDPVAFHLFSIPVHWYGIMYILALVSAYLFAKWIAKKDRLEIGDEVIDDYFIWVEIGVILGARLGYVLFYSSHTSYYLSHPWQIFNPFSNGEFVGIRGMSYHGALIGFLVASYLFAKKRKMDLWKLLDLVAISVPVGYIFGRIGNFLNHELVGRVTDVPWGIYVYGELRHPSQLYESLLEGVLLFLFLFWYRKRAKFPGELAMLYGIGYGVTRFIAEFWREPDIQLGFIAWDWLTMGQLLSLGMVVVGTAGYLYLRRER